MSEKLKNKSKKLMYYTNAGFFFNVFICYGSLDNKFVFQQICQIPAPQFELFDTFFHVCGVLLPDQAAHLSERERNFNERDTHCKIKKKSKRCLLFSKSRKQTYNDEGVFAVILNAGFVVQLISLIH